MQLEPLWIQAAERQSRRGFFFSLRLLKAVRQGWAERIWTRAPQGKLE